MKNAMTTEKKADTLFSAMIYAAKESAIAQNCKNKDAAISISNSIKALYFSWNVAFILLNDGLSLIHK
jgi:UDP-N-acetylmuramate-alanine ligase